MWSSIYEIFFVVRAVLQDTIAALLAPHSHCSPLAFSNSLYFSFVSSCCLLLWALCDAHTENREPFISVTVKTTKKNVYSLSLCEENHKIAFEWQKVWNSDNQKGARICTSYTLTRHMYTYIGHTLPTEFVFFFLFLYHWIVRCSLFCSHIVLRR